MNKTSFHISAMDCPSEERMVRMKLAEDPEIVKLEFDLINRNLVVWHNHEPGAVLNKLSALKLGENLTGSIVTSEIPRNEPAPAQHKETRLLRIVFFINAAFFVIELLVGWFARSMGLIADSLDMLADSFVYGMALSVAKKSIAAKKRIAGISGYLQLTLAMIGFAEVVRRTLFRAETPDSSSMILISLLALVANAICLYLLQKSGSKEIHMQATMIFTSNDVIINAGVIFAGILVYLSDSVIPDLVIGSIVFLLVTRGAIRILRL